MICYPSTPGRWAMTIGCFIGGATLMAVGLHYSYENVAPQQARLKARHEFVKNFLKRKYGYDWD